MLWKGHYVLNSIKMKAILSIEFKETQTPLNLDKSLVPSPSDPVLRGY